MTMMLQSLVAMAAASGYHGYIQPLVTMAVSGCSQLPVDVELRV